MQIRLPAKVIAAFQSAAEGPPVTLNYQDHPVAVEAYKCLDGSLLLIVFVRWGDWEWRWDRYSVDLSGGLISIPENLPLRLLSAALAAVAGVEVVQVADLYARCLECGTLHENWFLDGDRLTCYLCGWHSGTTPSNHPKVGDVFTVPNPYLVVHPETVVRVLGAHNQVTAFCGGLSPDLSAREWELPRSTVPYRKLHELLPDYYYKVVQVEKLPAQWEPVPWQ